MGCFAHFLKYAQTTSTHFKGPVNQHFQHHCGRPSAPLPSRIPTILKETSPHPPAWFSFLDFIIVQNDSTLGVSNSQNLFYGHLLTFHLLYPLALCIYPTSPYFPRPSAIFWIHLPFYPNIVVNNFNNICAIIKHLIPLLTYNLHIVILQHSTKFWASGDC